MASGFLAGSDPIGDSALSHHICTLTGRSTPGQLIPDGVASSIRLIAIEEMQHMAIACNLLASTGAPPNILAAVSTYPTTLPKDVQLAPTARPLEQRRKTDVNRLSLE